MSPSELVAKMQALAETPPSTRPFADAAARAVVGAQSDLARFNHATATSFAVEASSERVTVRWFSSTRPGVGGSQLSPSAAIRGHLTAQMKVARAAMRQAIDDSLAS